MWLVVFLIAGAPEVLGILGLLEELEVIERAELLEVFVLMGGRHDPSFYDDLASVISRSRQLQPLRPPDNGIA